MDINGFKGSLYDILGYFAPGLVSIIGYILIIPRMFGTYCTLDVLKTACKDISGFEIFLLIIIAYIFGHVLASLSSFIIENQLVKKVEKLHKSISGKKILGDEHYTILCAKYKKTFNAQYSDENLRRIICYVQSKQNLVYETALIFLSFYGMARNFAFSFGIFSVMEIMLCIFKRGHLGLFALFLIVSMVFLHEYIRFRKYYIDTILSSFLIPEKIS